MKEKEHKKNKKSISTPTTTKNKFTKEERVPEWFDKEIEKVNATEEEQEEMASLLSKYK